MITRNIRASSAVAILQSASSPWSDRAERLGVDRRNREIVALKRADYPVLCASRDGMVINGLRTQPAIGLGRVASPHKDEKSRNCTGRGWIYWLPKFCGLWS